MMSNKITGSLEHDYAQMPLKDSTYNKKVQKHIPQRLDVIGYSSEFTVNTKLLELLPDECMVGLECCYMNDQSLTETNLYEEVDTGIYDANNNSLNLSTTTLIPSAIVIDDNNLIQCKNIFNGILTLKQDTDGTPANLSALIQSKQSISSTIVAQYTFTFEGFTFNSSQAVNQIAFGLSSYPINDTASKDLADFPICFINLGPSTDTRGWRISSIINLPDSSQSILLQNTENPIETFNVGDLVYLRGEGAYQNIIYTVQEVIDSYTLRITLGFQDVYYYGQKLSDVNYDTIYILQHYNSYYATFDANAADQYVVYPGNQIQILQNSDGTFDYLTLNRVDSPKKIRSIHTAKQSVYSYISTQCDANFRMNIQTNSCCSTSSITNINIESPLFTSARTYDTNTEQYSQSIASLPYPVSFREPVNNRNCSMYNINKNILNNFQIPFRITQNDGSQLYVPQSVNFFIRFTLWFYEQTDDNRFYYLPSL